MSQVEKYRDERELKSKSVEPKVIENEKKKNEAKSKLNKDNFIPPDGGWGWIIVLAAGFSNFCIFPLMQSFGLIFRDKLEQMGISSSEITTLMNINNASTSFIGLANGPLFRKFSTRKIGFIGGLICACSITMLSRTESFTEFLIFFSILYGCGIGITTSANALVLNTYFKEKRRVATGFSWTVTGMGPIVMPQIITQLMPIYGMEGTVLIYGGLAFNSVVCALLFQPVYWHAKKKVQKDPENAEVQEKDQKVNNSMNEATETLLTGQNKSPKNVTRASKMSLDIETVSPKELFGSQYLYYDDEELGASGIDIIGPGTPMMSRANDGWSSKLMASNASLASSKIIKKENSLKSRRASLNLGNQSSSATLSSSVKNLNRLSNETENNKRRVSNTIENSMLVLSKTNETENAEKSNLTNFELQSKTHVGDNASGGSGTIKNDFRQENNFIYWLKRMGHAIVIFFDLDLLRDPIYVNLMLGITFANFTELNFALLTPFILGEYGFTKSQVATFMSVLGGVDVLTRIIIPFIATFINWKNRTFFLLGVSALAAGRLVLAHVHSYEVSIAVAIWMGTGKAMRTIFMALVIPSHVPLSRLPAASGLQLVTSGIVFMCVGPIVGWFRDSLGDYAVTLHCLNIFTYLTIISWTIEAYYTKHCKRKNISDEIKK